MRVWRILWMLILLGVGSGAELTRTSRPVRARQGARA